jgi:MGT family glycosyltransferase
MSSYRRSYRAGAAKSVSPVSALSVRRATTPERERPHGLPRAHVAVIGVPAPSRIYPNLPLVRELVKRGHRVSYVVGEAMAGIVEGTGAEVRPYASLLSSAPSSTDPVAATDAFLDEGIHALPQIRTIFDGDAPAIVLFDSAAVAGEIAASRWRVPGVELSVTTVSTASGEADVRRAYDAFVAMPGGQECLGRRLAWSAAEGEGIDLARLMAGPEHTIALIPKMLQPDLVRVASSTHFVGPLFDEARFSGSGWSPPEGSSRPILLVAFGTIFTEQLSVYRACLEAFADGTHHLVLAVGKHIDPAAFGDTPEFVEIHRTVSQLGVLRRASAFVTHGGMGSVVEALWFGVPMLVVPQAADQFQNAKRVVQLGVARQLPSDGVTPEALRRGVEQLTGDVGVRLRLVQLARQVRAEASVDRAADVVDALLGEATAA